MGIDKEVEGVLLSNKQVFLCSKWPQLERLFVQMSDLFFDIWNWRALLDGIWFWASNCGIYCLKFLTM
jgi:hypothetical protein